VVRPIKQGNDNKIDGAVALIMAVGRVMAPQEDDDPYASRGLRTL